MSVQFRLEIVVMSHRPIVTSFLTGFSSYKAEISREPISDHEEIIVLLRRTKHEKEPDEFKNSVNSRAQPPEGVHSGGSAIKSRICPDICLPFCFAGCFFVAPVTRNILITKIFS